MTIATGVVIFLATRWGQEVLIFGVGGVLVAILVAFLTWRAWPRSLLLAVIVAPLLTHYRWEWGAISLRPEHVVGVLLCGLMAFHLLVRWGRIYLPSPAWFGLAWWGMNLFTAMFTSPHPAVAVRNALRLGLMVATFILTSNLITNPKQWRWAVNVFLVAGVVEALVGLASLLVYPFGHNLGVQMHASIGPIPYGTFQEGNLFGSHSAAWLLTLFALVMADRQGYWTGWRRAGLVVLAIAVGLSLARASWLMLVVGASLIWIMQQRTPRQRLFVMTFLLVAAPVILLLAWGLVHSLPDSSFPLVVRLKTFSDLSADRTVSARLADWSLAWTDWRERPLMGWGPGSFFALHDILRNKPAWISSLSLRLLHETGLIGSLLFVGFLVTLIVPAMHTAQLQSRSYERGAMLGLTISYAVLLGVAYQSTDGSWLAASWVHAGLIAAGIRVLSTHLQPGTICPRPVCRPATIM